MDLSGKALADRINALFQLNWEGWLNQASVDNLIRVLDQQQKENIVGDILEIGVFRGKFAVLLAAALRPTEDLYLVDLFAPLPPGQDTGSINNERDLRHWAQHPAYSEDQLLSKFKTVLDSSTMEHIRLVKCDSIAMPLTGSFRVIHVDGNHAFKTVLHDLLFSFAHVVVGGTVIVDDWCHTGWPQVGLALEAAMQSRSDMVVTATDTAKCYLRRVE